MVDLDRLLSHGAVDLMIRWLNESPTNETQEVKTAYALGRLKDWLEDPTQSN